jgi:hypothetical protein
VEAALEDLVRGEGEEVGHRVAGHLDADRVDQHDAADDLLRAAFNALRGTKNDAVTGASQNAWWLVEPEACRSGRAYALYEVLPAARDPFGSLRAGGEVGRGQVEQQGASRAAVSWTASMSTSASPRSICPSSIRMCTREMGSVIRPFLLEGHQRRGRLLPGGAARQGVT